jgi:hypothetical protein
VQGGGRDGGRERVGEGGFVGCFPLSLGHGFGEVDAMSKEILQTFGGFDRFSLT